MRFADVIGNGTVAKALVSMADSGRVAHAMLMYENEGCGALALALAYVQYLNCSNPSGGDSCGECPSCRQMSKLIHPDVHFIFPVNKGPKTNDEKPTSESYLKYWRELALADPYFTEADLQKAIGIESKVGLVAVAEAKSIISKLSLASVSDGYKAVIFYLPEKMNQETANRLLKMVEEPPEKTVFLFITHAPEKVLQTIFSRCQSIRVMPLSKEEAAQVEQLVKDNKIRDCVSFKDVIQSNSNHFTKLIINGEATQINGSGSGANPRTCIGQRADGTVLMFVTDGRGASGHIGATAADLISVMKEYGAVNAANLDGGSSSSMVYNGKFEMTSVTLYYSTSSWRLPTAFIVK